jgi:hypothetical protein
MALLFSQWQFQDRITVTTDADYHPATDRAERRRQQPSTTRTKPPGRSQDRLEETPAHRAPRLAGGLV